MSVRQSPRKPLSESLCSVGAMNTADVAKAFSENWLVIVSLVFSWVVVDFLLGVPDDVGYLRRKLGRSLNQFAEVPRERLDSTLLTAAQSARNGWRRMALSFGRALCVGAGFFAAQVFRASFPQQSRWLSYVIAMLVVGLLVWIIHLMERRAILRRLQLLHHDAGSA